MCDTHFRFLNFLHWHFLLPVGPLPTNKLEKKKEIQLSDIILCHEIYLSHAYFKFTWKQDTTGHIPHLSAIEACKRWICNLCHEMVFHPTQTFKKKEKFKLTKQLRGNILFLVIYVKQNVVSLGLNCSPAGYDHTWSYLHPSHF